MTFESKALRPKRSASAATSRVARSQVGSHPPKAGRRPPGGAVSSAAAGRRAAPRPRERDPGQPRRQVDHRRVLQRHRRVDLAPVEPDQRDAERQQREQVEGAPRQQPPRAGGGQQRDQEQQAQRDPDRRPRDRPPEGAVVAARHRPGHLGPGPHLGDLAALVGHQHLGLDGLLPLVVLADVEDGVDAGGLVEVHRRARQLAVVDPVVQALRGAGDRLDLVLGQRGLGVGRRKPQRALDLRGLVADGAHDAVGGPGRLGGRRLLHGVAGLGGGGRGPGQQGGDRRDDGDAPDHAATGRTSGG